jgi:hypothetical protein
LPAIFAEGESPLPFHWVQILLGHPKIEPTVRNLGVEVEDALTLAEGTEG